MRAARWSWARRISLIVAVLTLGFGPWLRLPGAFYVISPAMSYALASEAGPSNGQVLPPEQGSRSFSRASGCTCREVVIEASNVVRDAEVRTGDAKVVNHSITYIAPSYGDTDVEVEQEAEAISGDAIAGQVLAVNGGDGCSRVHITASNIVENAEVRSGDAFAANRSVILIDPSIPREDLEIEVEQEAVARSGAAIAGQVIGVQGGGPCGGVILDALNRVRNVELRTGDALTENVSDILTCKDVGCIDDIRRMLRNVESVDVCNADGCEAVPVKEFIVMLEEQAANPPSEQPDDDEEDEGPRSAIKRRDDHLDNPKVKQAQPWRYPKPKLQTPEPSPTPSPSPTPTPSPDPSPAD